MFFIKNPRTRPKLMLPKKIMEVYVEHIATSHMRTPVRHNGVQPFETVSDALTLTTLPVSISNVNLIQRVLKDLAKPVLK
ncbi:hypothetical protein RSK60_1720055 [Ralstonia solanacearum K60]|nr:hypothetical protein RSK60_1720055 [Ralstonia solanacearum K60]